MANNLINISLVKSLYNLVAKYNNNTKNETHQILVSNYFSG